MSWDSADWGGEFDPASDPFGDVGIGMGGHVGIGGDISGDEAMTTYGPVTAKIGLSRAPGSITKAMVEATPTKSFTTDNLLSKGGLGTIIGALLGKIGLNENQPNWHGTYDEYIANLRASNMRDPGLGFQAGPPNMVSVPMAGGAPATGTAFGLNIGPGMQITDDFSPGYGTNPWTGESASDPSEIAIMLQKGV